jgi:phosphoserine phosphatase
VILPGIPSELRPHGAPFESIRLAFFDVDGTLTVERDPYVYLHRRLGTVEHSLSHVQMFKRGEIDYDEWGRLDAKLWAGQDVGHVTRLLAEIPWMPGAHRVAAALRRAGVGIALISSGLDVHVNAVAAELGASYAFANELRVAQGRLTGELRTVVPEWGKGDIARQVMTQAGVSTSGCIAIGDGLSDVKMFEQVGWSVAVAPDDEQVQRAASLSLPEPDLRPLASLFEEGL